MNKSLQINLTGDATRSGGRILQYEDFFFQPFEGDTRTGAGAQAPRGGQNLNSARVTVNPRAATGCGTKMFPFFCNKIGVLYA